MHRAKLGMKVNVFELLRGLIPIENIPHITFTEDAHCSSCNHRRCPQQLHQSSSRLPDAAKRKGALSIN